VREYFSYEKKRRVDESGRRWHFVHHDLGAQGSVPYDEQPWELTWTWMLEDKWLGQAVKGRTTVTAKSASQFTVKYEMLEPNGRYVTITEGTPPKSRLDRAA
jgi:hypothetical protein